MKHRLALSIAGLCLLGATLAIAAEGAPRGRERAEAAFAESDSNHDGRLSQSEWQAARLREANERFRRMDANRDGNLTREELRQAARERHQERREQRFERMDTDGDGKLSREELAARRGRHRDDAKR